MTGNLTFKPLTRETWKGFEKLFGANGACGGCWCMTWRLSNAEYNTSKGAGNKAKMKAVVNRGEAIGIIAYIDEEPKGWCAVAPREKYIRLLKSRALKPIDDKLVWSVSCFFMHKAYRRKGLSVPLLKAAIEYARSLGATIIEGYPVEPKNNKMPDVFAWTGILASYVKVGFTEEKRNSPTRPIVRYYL